MEFKAGRAGKFTSAEQKLITPKMHSSLAKMYGVATKESRFRGNGEWNLHDNTPARRHFLDSLKGKTPGQLKRGNQVLQEFICNAEGWQFPRRLITATKVGAGAKRTGWGNVTRPASAVKVTKPRARRSRAKVTSK